MLEVLDRFVLFSCRETPNTLSIPLDITEFRFVDPGKNELANASEFPLPFFFFTFFGGAFLGGALLGGAFLVGALLGGALLVTLLPLVELRVCGLERFVPFEFDRRTTVPEPELFVRDCGLVTVLFVLFPDVC